MTDKPTITIESIPLEEIIEARNALAGEYLTLRLEVEKPSLITRIHKKRIMARIFKLEKYLIQLDEWIAKVKQ